MELCQCIFGLEYGQSPRVEDHVGKWFDDMAVRLLQLSYDETGAIRANGFGFDFWQRNDTQIQTPR